MKTKAKKYARISLENMKFSGTYGLYPVEKKWSTDLLVTVVIDFSLPEKECYDLEDTIDYQRVYHFISEILQQPEELLENIAQRIINVLSVQFQSLHSVIVEIRKQAQLGTSYDGVVVRLEESRGD